jgi:hypothetical protein
VDGGREGPTASSPLATGGGRDRRGWEVGRPEVRASGFWVVEAAESGDDDDGVDGGVRVRVRGSGSPADLEMRGGRGAAGGPAVETARPAGRAGLDGRWARTGGRGGAGRRVRKGGVAGGGEWRASGAVAAGRGWWRSWRVVLEEEDEQ